jgi:hypothetical protein
MGFIAYVGVVGKKKLLSLPGIEPRLPRETNNDSFIDYHLLGDDAVETSNLTIHTLPTSREILENMAGIIYRPATRFSV